MKDIMKKTLLTVFILFASISPTSNATITNSFLPLAADCDSNPLSPKCEVRNFYNKVLNCTISTTIGLNSPTGVIERLQVQNITLQPNSKVIVIGNNYPNMTFKYINTSVSCFQPY